MGVKRRGVKKEEGGEVLKKRREEGLKGRGGGRREGRRG